MSVEAGRTIEIWADSRRDGVCTGCQASIEWAHVVKTGARMPFDQVEVVSAHVRMYGGMSRTVELVNLDRNHWASCPKAGSFKRSARKGADHGASRL